MARFMWDRPSQLSWALTSSNSGATLVTSFSYLTDGKVALPTRLLWDNLPQTTTSTVTLTATYPSIPSSAYQFYAMLFPRTAYAPPVGTKINVLGVRDDGTLVALGGNTQTQRTVLLDNGAVAIYWMATSLSPPGGHTWKGVAFQIYNDVNGSASIAAGQNFDIGEIWYGTGVEFKITDQPQDGLTDPTTSRRSHSNQPWPLFQKPYDTLSINFSPMSDSSAYDLSSTVSFKQLRYDLTTAQSVLILPRYYAIGTTNLDVTAMHQLAIFGRPESLKPLAGMAGAHLWTASIEFGEAPP